MLGDSEPPDLRAHMLFAALQLTTSILLHSQHHQADKQQEHN